MSAVKPLDSYIKNSVRLFEANPSETIFTLTYKPIRESTKKTSVVFATHNSQLDTNYKFTTNKSKDVSRLLNAIGPRGVSTIPTKIERQAMRKNKTNKKVKKNKKAKIVDTIGISNLIVNAKVKEYKPVETKTNAAKNDNNNSGNSNKKGNKKNKNKKRR